MVKINPAIKKLVRIYPEGGRGDYLRLDMNENPEGLPEEFVEEVKAKITPAFLATYPEQQDMLRALADYHQLPTDRFSLTDGSEMAIKHVFEVFAVPGSNVVTVTPSFAMYGVFCEMFGVEHRAVPIRQDFAFPYEAYLAAIDAQTSMVVLLSPNNPVGGVLSPEQMEAIIARAAQYQATVIIDEAYHYFCPVSYLELAEKYDNVVVFRTFSKLFSLAACRLGYTVSCPQLAVYLNRVRPTFEANSLALLFGAELLRRPALIQQLIKTEREGRDYLVAELTAHGYEPLHDGGNYVLFRPHLAPTVLAERLAAARILIKTYAPGSLLGGMVRISTGSRAVMEQFLAAFLPLDSGAGEPA